MILLVDVTPRERDHILAGLRAIRAYRNGQPHPGNAVFSLLDGIMESGQKLLEPEELDTLCTRIEACPVQET
jgi:hypothetical protein